MIYCWTDVHTYYSFQYIPGGTQANVWAFVTNKIKVNRNF